MRTRSRLFFCLFCNLVFLLCVQAQTPLATWQVIAPGFGASFNKPFVNDTGQTAYINKTNGFSLGIVDTPAQRNLQPLLSSNGFGLDVVYCIVGDNGRVGYSVGHALIEDAPGSQQILAHESGPVPGLPAGVLFDDYTFVDDGSIPTYFAMSPSGVFVLPSILKGTGISVTGTTNINDQVVLRGPASDFKPIARAGDAAPGLPTGYRFVGRLTRRFDVVINREGITAIRTRAILWNPASPFPGQNAEGIWLHDPTGGLRLAVTAVSQGTNPRGDIAPGTDGARFTAITMGPSINDEGYLAFAANTFNFAASPPNKSGIWSGPTNDLQPVHLFVVYRTISLDRNHFAILTTASPGKPSVAPTEQAKARDCVCAPYRLFDRNRSTAYNHRHHELAHADRLIPYPRLPEPCRAGKGHSPLRRSSARV